MDLIFERGDRQLPVGHALIYFRSNDGAIMATYVSVPPIPFDLSSYVPGFLANAMQGMDLSNAVVAAPMPPIPEEVQSIDYLHELADRRHDDLVYGGGTMREPMRLAAEAAEAARMYGELYASSIPEEAAVAPEAELTFSESQRFAGMSEQEQLNELTRLTGRLRDSLRNGTADDDVERQMRQLGALLPAKYRVENLVEAALIPGERGQKLAQLHLERCYKLYNEEYLELERIDREIEAIGG